MTTTPTPATTVDPLAPGYRPSDFAANRDALAAHFDREAEQRARWRRFNGTYHAEVLRMCRFVVEPGARVLDLGCGTGDLLAALEPSYGVGVDISAKMVELARAAHPQLTFVQDAAETWQPDEAGATFDYVILSDLVQLAYDIGAVFRNVRRLCHARTRIIVHSHSQLWRPILGLATTLGLKARQPVLNWVTTEDITNLMDLSALEPVATQRRILLPLFLPLLTWLCNRLLVRLPIIKHLALTNWVVARPSGPGVARDPAQTSVSIVVAARNEEGNVPAIVARMPQLGRATELIFVEGNSSDDTTGAIQREIAAHPELDISLHHQQGKGKGDAVRVGFAAAKHDVLMILDADLTVAPEDLQQFFDALCSGRGEFINGSRLVYPMEGRAMRFLNLVGNKFFAGAFSYLLGQRIKDTLCGTKVLLRADYERIARGRAYFGEFDPFGDFDLLFGAARLHLKIVEVPIRYRDRVWGTTQIRRWRDGVLLLRMCLVAFRKLRLQ
ncbi:MAG: glycosyltransferase [Planctomycetota bacterium]